MSYGPSAFHAECELVTKTVPSPSNGLPKNVMWIIERVEDALGKDQTVLWGSKLLFRKNPNVAKQPQSSEFDDEDDNAVLRAPSLAEAICSYQVRYAITLSPTFQIPVLHFTVSEMNGQPISDAADLRRKIFPGANIEGDGTSPFVTLMMHELLDRVMFGVHPCDAHEAMKMIPVSDFGAAGKVERVMGLCGLSVGLFE